MLNSILEGFGWTIGVLLCLGISYLVVRILKWAPEILIIVGALALLIYLFRGAF